MKILQVKAEGHYAPPLNYHSSLVGCNGCSKEDLPGPSTQVFSAMEEIMAFSVVYLLSSFFPRTTRYSPAMINNAPIILHIALKANNSKIKQVVVTWTGN